MKAILATALRLGVGVAVSVLAVFLLVRSLNLGEVGQAMSEADLRTVVPAVALYFVGIWIRSVRWRWLLPAPRPPTGTLFRALIVGFTINNLIPARVGELARAYLVGQWAGVPYGSTLASLVVERILDGLALAALLVVAVLATPSAPGYILAIGAAVGAAFAVAAILVGLTTWNEPVVLRIARRLGSLLPPRIMHLVGHVLEGFIEGLRVVRGPGNLLSLAAVSLVAWCCELGLFWILALGFPMPHQINLAFLAGAVGNFATLVPSSPGYVGTFDGAIARVFADAARVPNEQATAYAILVHAAVLVPVVVLGLLILWRSGLGIGQVTERATRRLRSEAAPDPSLTV